MTRNTKRPWATRKVVQGLDPKEERMKRVSSAIVMASCLVFFGCATVGEKFDTTHVNEIQNGEHDKAQITAWFGPPHKTVSPLSGHPAGCVERWQWTHAHSVAFGKTVSDSLVVDFDTDGKVCDNGFSQMNQ